MFAGFLERPVVMETKRVRTSTRVFSVEHVKKTPVQVRTDISWNLEKVQLCSSNNMVMYIITCMLCAVYLYMYIHVAAGLDLSSHFTCILIITTHVMLYSCAHSTFKMT